MNALNKISSSQFANSVFDKIDNNFKTVENAINALEQGGGGGGGGTTFAIPKFRNNPFPAWKDTISILSIGNSYALNPTAYIKDILTENDKAKVNLTVLSSQGQSLEGWATTIANSGNPSTARTIGDLSVAAGNSSLVKIQNTISRPWDIIVLQQNSDNVDDYSTYEPYLSSIVNAIRSYCTNQKVCIAWQMVWSKSNEHPHADILAATKQVIMNNGIDVVIPTGTAIQNARAAFQGNSMLRDGTHLAYGVAKYVGAMTWIQTLIAPALGLNIIGHSATHEIGGTYDGVTESASDPNAVAVDNENKLLCQQCAMDACTNMWNDPTIS